MSAVCHRFTPLQPKAKSAAVPAGAAAPPSPWKGNGRVLLVDDEDMVRSVATLMLKKMGFEVLTASDGREAVAAFKLGGSRIDAVVLDMTMPHMDGREALRAIRALRADVPVLMTSGFTEEDVASDVAEERHVGFLQKPFNSAALAEKLSGLLARSRAASV